MASVDDGVRGSSVPVRTPVKMKKVRSGTSGTEPETPSSTSQAESASTPAELQAALNEAHIYLLAPARQRAIAEQLAKVGVTVSGIEDLVLYTHVRAESEAQASRILATVVAEPEGCRVAIKSLDGWRAEYEHEQQRREEADAKAAAKGGPKQTQPWADLDKVDDQQREVWEHDRMCRIVYCRVAADRRTPDDVADEFGLRKGTVTAMLDRGRVLSQPPPELCRASRVDALEPQEERTRRFVETMRAKSAGGAS